MGGSIESVNTLKMINYILKQIELVRNIPKRSLVFWKERIIPTIPNTASGAILQLLRVCLFCLCPKLGAQINICPPITRSSLRNSRCCYAVL